MGAPFMFSVFLILCEILFAFGDQKCENEYCLRKCCPDGQTLDYNTNTGATSCVSISSPRTVHKQLHDVLKRPIVQNIIHGDGCEDDSMDKIYLDPDEYSFELNDRGILIWEGMEFNYKNVCVDANNGSLVAIGCVIGEEEAGIIAITGMIISMPFLLATFIAYALLPDRNLHMKALMFYVITLMISYLLLVIVQLTKSRFEDTVCTLIGYFCLFFFLVSFFWMNVICIDIWFAFSGLRGFSGSKKIAERKRFFIYCAYAWGMPIIHVLIIFAIQSLSSTVQWYNPAIGEGQCFLKRGYAELIYFYGPMAFLIGINIIFFAITALKIRSVKKDTSMLKNEDNKRHSYENDKQTFNLYLKLLFAMGVNWSMEIISWAVIWANVAPDWIWYLTDFCNAIYGVFIFFIFVFKKSIWKLLKKRYYSFMGRSHLAHSMASTNATRTTSYSTANTMHDNPHGGGLHDTSTLTSEA